MKYLLMLLFMVGCTAPPSKYKVGEHIKSGKCHGYVGLVMGTTFMSSFLTNYRYQILDFRCGDYILKATFIHEDDIEGVIE